MTKTKDTIEGLKKLFKNNKPEYSNEEEYQKEQQFLSHAIQIAQAQEQAEGMLKEKKVPKPYSYSKNHISCSDMNLAIGFNQAISIATPILAKKILECEEKDKRIEELTKTARYIRVEEQYKLKIEELEKELDACRDGNSFQKKRYYTLESKLTMNNFETIFIKIKDDCKGKHLTLGQFIQALIKELETK